MATSKCDCTHLNVHQRKIVHLATHTIQNNNIGAHPFYYDSSATVFSVPKGWSFLVTDIFLFSSPVQGPIPDPDRFILGVINFSNFGDRIFEGAVLTDATGHFPLSGAYVIPAGHAPTFRNTSFSTSYAKARLLGYFVAGNGLQPGEVPFALTAGDPASADQTAPSGDADVS
jgi:hypothetical protein